MVVALRPGGRPGMGSAVHTREFGDTKMDADFVTSLDEDGDMTTPARYRNGPVALFAYDVARYDGWPLDQIISKLRGTTLHLLKRGTKMALVARREWGGLLVAACKRVATSAEQSDLFRRILDVNYSDARRHMKLWVYWPRVEQMLIDRAESFHKRHVPFVIPGYKRCLELAGITRRMKPAIPLAPPPPPVVAEPLPADVAVLMARVAELEKLNRLEREKTVRLTVALYEIQDELAELKQEPSKRRGGWFHNLTEWVGGKLPFVGTDAAEPAPERSSTTEVRIGDCRDLIEPEENIYDAIVTDPPYQISLHGLEWDSDDITFSPDLWRRLFRVLKPGGYLALFAAPRLYHRAATACENAGFILHPFLTWRFRDGLPKPVNLSELFDRDNLTEREIIGTRRGSGFTQANVDHGAQNRSHTTFAAHARHVSEEAQRWRGYFYGLNTLKPCEETILLAQKPISTGRVIDNVRRWGTGALNVGALQDRYGTWPTTTFSHRKAQKAEHQTDHPSVKPLPLMEDLCTLVCPAGGVVLDPFAGTGTTGVAARNRHFDCVLIEQNPAMRQVIEERLRRET